MHAILLIWVWIVVGGGVLVIGIVSCSLMSVQKPLHIVSYLLNSKCSLPSGRTYSMVCERWQALIDSSFRVPVSNYHECDEEEEYPK